MNMLKLRVARCRLGTFARIACRPLSTAGLLLAASTAPVIAQRLSTAPSPLTLDELYAQVARNNPRASAARALAQAAQARIPGASRPPDPQLQLGFMNRTLPNLAPMPVLGMTQVQVMQMIPLSGKLGWSGRVARVQASAANARSDDAGWDARTRAAMMFYDLHVTDRGLDVARETLRLLADIARTAESMYRVGDGRQADVLRAQVALARMEEDTLRMQAMREVAEAAINALNDHDADATVGTPVLPEFPDSVPTRRWLDSVAVGNRPMIRAGVEDVRAAEATERLSQKEIIPDLTVGVQYGQQGGAMGGTERMGSLMLGVSVPVFARSRQLRMRDETSAMRQMAQAELTAMRAETRGKIGEAYAALTRARRLMQLYRTTVIPQAEAAAASALSTYRVGGVDFMTVLDDRMTVNQYRQQLHALEAEQGKAWAELEMLVGRTLITPNGVAKDRDASSGDTP
ncbi:MAG: TolC family protein [Gemmatimonadaceae bacterium]|nr:TolC family protein [Gemmatimonadaceae bacterium]